MFLKSGGVRRRRRAKTGSVEAKCVKVPEGSCWRVIQSGDFDLKAATRSHMYENEFREEMRDNTR